MKIETKGSHLEVCCSGRFYDFEKVMFTIAPTPQSSVSVFSLFPSKAFERPITSIFLTKPKDLLCIITHPVNFPCARKLKYPERTLKFGWRVNKFFPHTISLIRSSIISNPGDLSYYYITTFELLCENKNSYIFNALQISELTPKRLPSQIK